MFTVRIIKCYLRKLTEMTAVKTGVGLLYNKSDADVVKQLKTELTNRCSDIEIRADIAIHNTGA